MMLHLQWMYSLLVAIFFLACSDDLADTDDSTLDPPGSSSTSSMAEDSGESAESEDNRNFVIPNPLELCAKDFYEYDSSLNRSFDRKSKLHLSAFRVKVPKLPGAFALELSGLTFELDSPRSRATLVAHDTQGEIVADRAIGRDAIELVAGYRLLQLTAPLSYQGRSLGLAYIQVELPPGRGDENFVIDPVTELGDLEKSIWLQLRFDQVPELLKTIGGGGVYHPCSTPWAPMDKVRADFDSGWAEFDFQSLASHLALSDGNTAGFIRAARGSLGTVSFGPESYRNAFYASSIHWRHFYPHLVIRFPAAFPSGECGFVLEWDRSLPVENYRIIAFNCDGVEIYSAHATSWTLPIKYR